jgi:hypothetical protein
MLLMIPNNTPLQFERYQHYPWVCVDGRSCRYDDDHSYHIGGNRDDMEHYDIPSERQISVPHVARHSEP